MPERTFGVVADAYTQRVAVLAPEIEADIRREVGDADPISFASQFAARAVARVEEHHNSHVTVLSATIKAQQDLIEEQRPYAIRRTAIRWAGTVIIWLSGVGLLYSLIHN